MTDIDEIGPKMKSMNKHRVAVLAYDGISPFHLSVPCMVFGDDLSRLGVPRYDLIVCAEKVGSISTLSGFSIDVTFDLDVFDSADTVIVPAWTDPADQPSEALLEAGCSRGRPVCGRFCFGRGWIARQPHSLHSLGLGR
ncbi:MAG: hypothetical protein WBP13_06010 [Methylophilaceae bacterium]